MSHAANSSNTRVTQALVITAGRGSRLDSLTRAGRAGPKTLLPVLGVPIVDRTLATLSRVGIRDVVITVGFEGDQVRRHVGDGARFGLWVRYACNDHWDAGNARSVAAAKPLLTGDFLLVMGDHLVDERIVAAVARQAIPGDVLVAVDRTADREGATRVLIEGEHVVDIGKDIARWNATDIGVFRCSPKLLVKADALVATGIDELADVIGAVDADTFDIATIPAYVPRLRRTVRPWWADIDTPADATAAECLLIDNSTKEASDALARWVHRPIENALVAPLARSTPITPNALRHSGVIRRHAPMPGIAHRRSRREADIPLEHLPDGVLAPERTGSPGQLRIVRRTAPTCAPRRAPRTHPGTAWPAW